MVQLHESMLDSCSKFLWFITPRLIPKASGHGTRRSINLLQGCSRGTLCSQGCAGDRPWVPGWSRGEGEAPLFRFQAAQSLIQSCKDRICGICVIETQTKVRSMHPGRWCLITWVPRDQFPSTRSAGSWKPAAGEGGRSGAGIAGLRDLCPVISLLTWQLLLYQWQGLKSHFEFLLSVLVWKVFANFWKKDFLGHGVFLVWGTCMGLFFVRIQNRKSLLPAIPSLASSAHYVKKPTLD